MIQNTQTIVLDIYIYMYICEHCCPLPAKHGLTRRVNRAWRNQSRCNYFFKCTTFWEDSFRFMELLNEYATITRMLHRQRDRFTLENPFLESWCARRKIEDTIWFTFIQTSPASIKGLRFQVLSFIFKKKREILTLLVPRSRWRSGPLTTRAMRIFRNDRSRSWRDAPVTFAADHRTCWTPINQCELTAKS